MYSYKKEIYTPLICPAPVLWTGMIIFIDKREEAVFRRDTVKSVQRKTRENEQQGELNGDSIMRIPRHWKHDR